MVEYLVHDSAQISDDDQPQEEAAFPLAALGFPHLIQRKRPTRPKTNQHTDFKNTHASTPIIPNYNIFKMMAERLVRVQFMGNAIKRTLSS